MSTIDVCYEISKDDYDKAMKDGPYSIINPAIVMGYGAYGANVKEIGGKYYLSYSHYDSCD